MGRPRTGSAYRVTLPSGEKRWAIRATLIDGTRSKPVILPKGTSQAKALEQAKWLAEDVIKRGTTRETIGEKPKPGPQGETVAEYSERWLEDRERRGLSSVGDDRGRLKKWILPTLGELPIAGVTRQDVGRGRAGRAPRSVRRTRRATLADRWPRMAHGSQAVLGLGQVEDPSPAGA